MSQTKTTTAPPRGQHSPSLHTPRVAARPETKFPVTDVISFDDDYTPEDDPKSSSLSKDLAPHIVLSQLPIEMQRRCLSLTSAGALTKFGSKSKGASGHGWEDYSLRIILAGAVTTSGGGIVANVYSADPSNLSLSEWSSFASLFDEVKLQSFEMSVCPYSGQSAPAITSIAIGSFLNKGSVPGSILNVLVAPDGKLLAPNMVVPSGVHMKAPSLGFAPTTAPAGTTAYGCPGYIHLYATGVASTAIMTYVVVGRYHLRGRM
jgi:hypothetical protein